MVEETTGQLAERERAMAKAFSMSVLFGAEPYWKIVNILDKKETMSETGFENALKGVFGAAGLDKEDQEWAINYLNNYNKDLAAASDRKWPTHVDARKLHW